MANWSNTTIKINANQKDNEQIRIDAINDYKEFVNQFKKNNFFNPSKLMKDDSIDQRAKYSCAEIIVENQEKDDEIEYYIQGRWCSPSQMFIDACEKFKLSMLYFDRENGCNFTHVIVMENGKVKLDKQDAYISALALKYNEEEVYDEIIENYEDSEFFDEISIKQYIDHEENEELKKELIKAKCYKKFLAHAKSTYE